MKKHGLKFIDLFSGCGGFSYGMEMAGHQCLLGIDFEKSAVDSFAINHPRAHALHMDIHKLTKKTLESLIDVNQVDMVIGGPPCQGFSTVGRGQADDGRNSLFKQFVRIVKITKPKFILFENVTGILAKKNEKVLRNIFSSFERLGYRMDAQVLSADDFGTPSRRRRTIIMGVKNGIPSFPRMTHGEGLEVQCTVKDAFKNLNAMDGEVYNHDPESSVLKNKLDTKRLMCIPPGAGIRYERDEKAYLPKRLRYNLNWNEISEKRFRQTRLQRLDWETPAPTILTSRTMYYHPTEPRYLTCREAAACQSFPNDFVFKGSRTQIFRQIGNAVPPRLAMALGNHLANIEFDSKKAKKREAFGHESIRGKAFNYRGKNNVINDIQ